MNYNIPTIPGLVLIFLIAVFAGAGTILYEHKVLADQFLETEAEEIIVWNLYRDFVLGFSIDYPSDWNYKEDAFTGEISFGQEKDVDVEVLNGKNESLKIFKAGFTLKIYENKESLPGNPEGLSLDDWIFNNFLPLEGDEVKEEIIFGVGDYSGILLKKYKSLGINKLVTFVFAKNNEKIFELRGEIPVLATINIPTEYDYENVFDIMLSTFKFVPEPKPVKLGSAF